MRDNGDLSMEEKRVYAEKSDTTTAFVAAELGVVAVTVSADLVGEFQIEARCTARDVAAAAGRVAVATDEDVLLAGTEFRGTDFGPAVAVGVDGTALYAAGEDGRFARLDNVDDAWTWTTLGEVAPDSVCAIDGPFVAGTAGLSRVVDGGLEYAGLDDVRDVAAAGPYAATGDGLYRLGNGWMREAGAAGAFDAVAAAPDGRAHAVREGDLFERVDGEWHAVEVPTDEAVVDVAYAPEAGTFAVTETGTFLVTVGEGWRTRALGVRPVFRLAVP